MSLGVVIKGPEGVVLAADSRVTLEARPPQGPPLVVNFDNATKLLKFSGNQSHVGAVTYGAAVIGLRTAHSYLPEFENEFKDQPRLKILEFSQKLSAFFLKRWQESMPNNYPGPGMTFIVGGYDEGAAYGKVFLFEIPGKSEPIEQNPGANDFGMTWGGQLQIASRLIHGFDPALEQILRQQLHLNEPEFTQLLDLLRQQLTFTIPYQVLPLQDCVDLATFMIRSTITAQALAVGIRGVGGPIDVATITRPEGFKYVQRKLIRGETGLPREGTLPC